MAPRLSLGASFFVLDGTIAFTERFDYDYVGSPPGNLTGETYYRKTELDADGYGGRLGLQYYPAPLLCFGLEVTTPVWMNVQGPDHEEGIERYQTGPDTLWFDDGLIDTDFLLPFRVKAGLALRFKPLTLSVEAGYSDWTQATIDKTRLRLSPGLTPVFRAETDLRVGAELALPGAPVLLRGGYAYIPYPLAYVQTDRISNDRLRKARIDEERQVLSAGGSLLVQRVVSIDVAYENLLGQRSYASPHLLYGSRYDRVVLSASYRF